MKKLRMIVTSVVVLAIVGSAFAFKAKRGIFCVATTTTTNTCQNALLDDLKVTTGTGTQYHYYACWDGNMANCGGTNNCSSLVTLTDD